MTEFRTLREALRAPGPDATVSLDDAARRLGIDPATIVPPPGGIAAFQKPDTGNTP